jgi:hypothetical protein
MPVPGAIVETIPAVWKGSVIVHAGSGVVYRIKKMTSATLTITDVEGKEFVLKGMNKPGAWRAIREATKEEQERFRTEEFKRVLDPANVMRVGNVVRWPGAKHPLAKDKLLVVTKVNADGDANLSPLGGTLTGEFFRSVPAVHLEKVNFILEGEGFENV